jgi:crossover junction endodeoxyribonuclease RuvC
MFVLGIDPGLTTTGYGAVRRAGGRSEAVTAGVIRTDAALRVERRLAELYRDMRTILAELDPDVVAIEQVFVNRNLQTAMSVARASGVLMLAAAERDVPVFEYTPSSVKAAIAGYGSAPKEQVQKMVATRLRLASAPGPADAADALAVALCHVQSHRLATLEQKGTA